MVLIKATQTWFLSHNYFHLFDLSTIKKNPEVVDLRILIDLQELQLPALIIWRCLLFHLRGRDC